jgi:NAD(P)-dependent dehydrogenase (short-subunit alcohol dehydrogenase family)
MKLADKVAVVTGGSQGIGAAIATRFAAEGARVAIVNHSHPDRAAEIVSRISAAGGAAKAFQADLALVPEITRVLAEIAAHFGPVDILVNNAGLFLPTPLEDTSEETWDRMMDLNLKAAFFAVQAIAPGMKSRGSGKIINISSIAGQGAFPSSAAYCASKGGINLLTKALCLELASSGINVNGLAPGNVATPMNEALRADPEHCENMVRRTPTGQAFLAADDMAGCAVFLASADSDQVHGQTVGVDGGWMAW